MRSSPALTRLSLALAAACALACGSGSTEPTTKVDPYATFYIENHMTSARSGVLATSNYVLYERFELPQYPQPGDTTPTLIANGGLGAYEPAGHTCRSLMGYAGDRRLQIVLVADTLGGNQSQATYDGAARGTSTFAGMVRLSTPMFDPLVSADTSRGHTPDRPVRWRWTLTDSSSVFVEDSTAACPFQGAPNL